MIFVLAVAHVRFYFRGQTLPNDFAAFYCGGEVALKRDDFYRLQPLASCEERITDDGRLLRLPPLPPYGIPVPLPPYDFSALSLLALLHLQAAKSIFGALEIAAMLLIGGALSKLSGLPMAATLGVSFYGITYEAQSLGQLAPFAIAALATAAFAFRENRTLLGSVALSLSLLQPQIAMPAVLGALIAYPRARLAIVACVGSVAAIGFAFGGLNRTVEYFKLLPLHARAEIAFAPQYSLSFALHQAGIGVTQALSLGTLSYALTLAISLLIIVSKREAARRTGIAILLPAAFSVLGGSFIHAYQIAVALLVATVPAYSKWTAPFASIGIALLICPWTTLASVPFTKTILLSIVVALAVVAITIYFLQLDVLGKRQAAILSAVCVAVSLALFLTLHGARPDISIKYVPQIHAPALNPDTLGSVAWGNGISLINLTAPQRGSVAFQWANWYVKYPIWLALMLILACATYDFLRPMGRIMRTNTTAIRD